MDEGACAAHESDDERDRAEATDPFEIEPVAEGADGQAGERGQDGDAVEVSPIDFGIE